MKRFLFPLLLLILVSCGPSKHIMHIEMRNPSKSGIDLAGKNVSVVYLEGADPNESLFNGGMAEGLARSLEEDYCTGEGSVPVFRMPAKTGADYASRDSLITLLIDTDADVVFLFDEVSLGENKQGMRPFTMKLHCFDGMDKSEKVHTFAGSSHVSSAYETLTDGGIDAGKLISDSFKPQWKTEAYSLAYYDSEKWYKALDRAEAFDWKGAIDQWFTLLDTNDLMKRACAEYNIAVACYMLGNYSLAEQWLDRSDADNKLPNMSDILRKRIQSRK